MTEEEIKNPNPSNEGDPQPPPQNRPKPMEEEPKEDYKDKYLRLLAEIENMRKRMQKEKQENTRYAIDNIMSEILGPLDNLENALGFAQHSSEETRNWALGFQMILAQFKEILQNHGIVPFYSEGADFDPHLHEAVEMEETDKQPEGTILQEFIRGYKSGDRIIRPARVKVAKSPTSEKIHPTNKN